MLRLARSVFSKPIDYSQIAGHKEVRRGVEIFKFAGGLNGEIDNFGIGNRLAGGFTAAAGRPNNEDGILLALRAQKKRERLFMQVADGMGGYGNGETASAAALEIAAKNFCLGKVGTFSFSQTLDEIADSLEKWKFYCQNIDSRAGATLVGALIDLPGHLLHLAHIGDSRAYLFRRGELMMATLDHNLMLDFLPEALRDGYAKPTLDGLKKLLGNDLVAAYQRLVPPFPAKLSSLLYQLGTDYYNAPYTFANQQPIFGANISKALGAQDTVGQNYKGVDATYSTIGLLPRDIVVLASDGVHDFCGYDDLSAAIAANQNGTPHEIAVAIYKSLANMRDNVTIAVYKHA